MGPVGSPRWERPHVRFDPSSYPGRPPSGPTLVYQGRTWPLDVRGDTERPLDGDPVPLGAPTLDPGRVRWSLAYGANADPDRLVDKALDVNGAVVLPASVLGWARGWEARRTLSTGAVPLTLIPAPRRRLDVRVLGVHVDDVALLDASEGRGTNYALGRVGPVSVANRFLLRDALAYGPTAATRLLTAGPGPATFPEVDQAQALALEADPHRVTVATDPVPRPVDGAWPTTDLDDLPLFVYGTLQPGRQRWDQISDLVEVVGPAATAGRVTATFYGYPAVELGGRGQVHGTLLRPVGPRAARELVSRCDAIEDAPSLFQRRAAPVRVEDGWTWAIVYVWNPGQGPPPGSHVPDGRWNG